MVHAAVTVALVSAFIGVLAAYLRRMKSLDLAVIAWVSRGAIDPSRFRPTGKG